MGIAPLKVRFVIYRDRLKRVLLNHDLCAARLVQPVWFLLAISHGSRCISALGTNISSTAGSGVLRKSSFQKRQSVFLPETWGQNACTCVPKFDRMSKQAGAKLWLYKSFVCLFSPKCLYPSPVDEIWGRPLPFSQSGCRTNVTNLSVFVNLSLALPKDPSISPEQCTHLILHVTMELRLSSVPGLHPSPAYLVQATRPSTVASIQLGMAGQPGTERSLADLISPNSIRRVHFPHQQLALLFRTPPQAYFPGFKESALEDVKMAGRDYCDQIAALAFSSENEIDRLHFVSVAHWMEDRRAHAYSLASWASMTALKAHR